MFTTKAKINAPDPMVNDGEEIGYYFIYCTQKRRQYFTIQFKFLNQARTHSWP